MNITEILSIFKAFNPLGDPNELNSLVNEGLKTIAMISFLIATLQCFLGYKLFKFWVAVCGFFTFGILAGVTSGLISENIGMLVFVSIVFAILGAFIAFKLYKVGVFILCGVMGFLVGYILTQSVALGIVLALILGIVSMFFIKPVIIISTSVSNGLIAGTTLAIVLGIKGPLIAMFLGVVFAALGVLVQFATNKKMITSIPRETVNNSKNTQPKLNNIINQFSKQNSEVAATLVEEPCIALEETNENQGGILHSSKICSQCGNENKEERNFCTKCGYKLNIINEKGVEVTKEVEAAKEIEIKPNEKLNVVQPITMAKPKENNFVGSNKTKIGIIAVSIIVISTIIFFKVGNSLTQPSKAVAIFEKAISLNDKKELVNILYCSDIRLAVNEKTIEPLLSYFKENPSYLNTTIQMLNEIKTTKNANDLNEDVSENIFDIVTNGKKFIFFPNYKISIKPSFVQISTSIKDVDLSLNDISLGKSDTDNFSKEFGPFIPGKYKLSANYTGEYMSLNEAYDVVFFNEEDVEDGKKSIHTHSRINYVKIESEYADAKIFVDGKDTGVTVTGTENFGPLSSGTVVYGVAKENGKELKSDEIIVEEDSNNIYLNFEEARSVIVSLENDVKNLINNYTYYFGQAVNNNDFSVLEPYLYPTSKLYKEQQSYVLNMYDNGIKEYIDSFDIVSYNLNEDNKSGTISTNETYSIDNKGVTSLKSFKYTYTFKYNEGTESFQLDSITNN